MTVANSLRRLLRVLNLEEELHRRELESAQCELTLREQAMTMCGEREPNGRRWLSAGLQNGDMTDRLAGMEEIQTGKRCVAALQPHIDQSAVRVEECRAAFLEKRVERKQVQTVVAAAEAREVVVADRRAQQWLDDWCLSNPTIAKDGYLLDSNNHVSKRVDACADRLQEELETAKN